MKIDSRPPVPDSCPRIALFAILLMSYAYFYQAGGWNQNSRFDLVRAITNEHSLRIDAFQANTGDKAVFDGHYYSDKAPGLALSAVPIVGLARSAMTALGGDPESYAGLTLLSYLATVLTVGFLTAWAGVCLFNLTLECGATPGAALFAATAFGLASPMWPLATLFIGHAIATAGLLFAFAAAVRIGGDDRDIRLGLTVGFGAGWATVSEFPAAVPAAILAVLAFANAWPLGRARARRVVAALTAAAVACAAVLMAYHYACFGSPFHLAYANEQGFDVMKQGTFGMTATRMIRLRRILFGDYRGLLPLAPLLALAPLGLVALAVTGARGRRTAFVAALIAAYYILLNASYTYWEGGWSYGPRHMSPAIPFLCLGLAALWVVLPRILRACLLTLWLWGAALSFIAVSTTAQPPASFHRPVAELLWPAFRDGDLSLNTQRFTDSGADPSALRAHTEPKAAWNLGMKAGLTGWMSLAPLTFVWAAAGWWLIAGGRHRRPRRAS